MKPPQYRVISIGTLAAHPLWDEKIDVRTGHATTTLVTVGEANVLINPSLPGPALGARLSERTRVRPDEITHVFLTTFARDHYRGIACFPRAAWLIHAPEQAFAGAALDEQVEHANDTGDEELIEMVQSHRTLLERCVVAEDSIVPGVDLFPLPGLTPGTCGLLLPLLGTTVLVCGDAVATSEHLEQAKVLPTCADIEQAQDSLREALEIADVLVLGRDNLASNPLRRMM